MIIGYNGACRRDELINLTVDDINYTPDMIIISISKTKNNISRVFVITDKVWIDLIKKYYNLRPVNISHKRFFLTYRNGQCINSPMGINIMGKVPKEIACFLKLPNPELYTGHCFRRTSATHLVNHGGDLLTLKNHGGWKSSTVAEGYIESSISKKIKISHMLGCETHTNIPGCSKESTTIDGNNSFNQNILTNTSNLPGFTINAQDTSKISINVYNNCTIHNSN